MNPGQPAYLLCSRRFHPCVSVLTWATWQRPCCKSYELTLSLAVPLSAVPVSTQSQAFQCVHLLDEAQTLQPPAFLFALTMREGLPLPTLSVWCLNRWWLSSNPAAQNQDYLFLYLFSSLVGEHKCVSHYLACFTTWVPAGFIALGITQYFISQKTGPSLMFNNGSLSEDWKPEVLCRV